MCHGCDLLLLAAPVLQIVFPDGVPPEFNIASQDVNSVQVRVWRPFIVRMKAVGARPMSRRWLPGFSFGRWMSEPPVVIRPASAGPRLSAARGHADRAHQLLVEDGRVK